MLVLWDLNKMVYLLLHKNKNVIKCPSYLCLGIVVVFFVQSLCKQSLPFSLWFVFEINWPRLGVSWAATVNSKEDEKTNSWYFLVIIVFIYFVTYKPLIYFFRAASYSRNHWQPSPIGTRCKCFANVVYTSVSHS